MTQPPYLGYPGNGSIPVNRVCSYGRSMSNTNYLRAVAQGKPVELRVNGKTCSTNAAAIRAVVMSANVTKAQLAALCPSAMPTSGRIEPTLKINGAVALGGNSLDFEILYANNADVNIGGANGVGENGGTGYVAIAAEYDQANCTTTASPLVVRMPGAGGSKISLTSIAKGIFFDLLGRMNGHRKVRIGWFTNDDFALVALPNKNGEVRGIDELFGDHTTGPDGKISENGYAALAKYDDNRDGKIDRADRVFSELRLLLPVSGAIRSLEDTGVAFIDLDYSRDYFEVDQHGNETRMKSVVGYSDGSLDLIFDLWFRYQK